MIKTTSFSSLFFSRLLFLGGFFVSFGIFSASFAMDDTPPDVSPAPAELKWGAYTHWLESALEFSRSGRSYYINTDTDDRLPESQQSVKKSNSLATDTGEKILWVLDGKIGIGISTPREILDINSSEKASVAIKSTTDSSSLKIADAKLAVESGDFFLQLGSQKISFTDDGIDITGQITATVGGVDKNVVLGQQDCPEGERIVSTTDEGVVVCQAATEATIPVCNLNTTALDFYIAPLGRCKLGEASLPSCILDFSNTKLLDDKCFFAD